MKTVWATVLFALFAAIHANACENGCMAIGTTSQDLVPNASSDFVAIRWNLQRYHSFGHIFRDGEWQLVDESPVRVHQLAVNGRFYVHPKWYLAANVPFVFASNHDGNANGFGDISLLAGYRVFETAADKEDGRHRLTIQAGIKLPTAHIGHQRKISQHDAAVLVGTTSTDLLFGAEHIFRLRNGGLTSSVSYKLNTTGRNNYRFGDIVTIGSQGFYAWERNNWSVLPNAGLSVERLNNDKLNGVLQSGTSGWSLLYKTGIQVHKGRTAVAVTYQRAALDRFTNQNIKNDFRMDASVLVTF